VISRAELRPASVSARVLDRKNPTIDLTSSISGPKVAILTERPPTLRRGLPVPFVADCLPEKQPESGIRGGSGGRGSEAEAPIP